MMKNVHVGWGPVGMTKINSTQTTKLKLNISKVTLEPGNSYKIMILSEYEDTPVWSSSNQNVAIVDQEGNVTVVGYGTAYITVTSGSLKGTCTISVPAPITPDEPDQPEQSKLDKSKIYYGTITKDYTSYEQVTEDDIVSAIEAGTIKSVNYSKFESDINVMNQGDLVIVLIPGSYKSGVVEINGSKHEFVDNVTGVNFCVNGELKLGDFYMFGQWMFAAGLLKIYVE